MLNLSSRQFHSLDSRTALLNFIALRTRTNIDSDTTNLSIPSLQDDGDLLIHLSGTTSLAFRYSRVELKSVLSTYGKITLTIDAPTSLKDLLPQLRKLTGVYLTKEDVVDYRVKPNDAHVRLVARKDGLRYVGRVYLNLNFNPKVNEPITPKVTKRNIREEVPVPILVPTDETDLTTRDILDVVATRTHLRISPTRVKETPIKDRALELSILEEDVELEGTLDLSVVRGKEDSSMDLSKLIQTTHYREFPLLTTSLKSGCAKSILLTLVNSRNGTRIKPTEVMITKPIRNSNKEYNTLVTIIARPEGPFKGEVTLYYNRVKEPKVRGVTIINDEYYRYT